MGILDRLQKIAPTPESIGELKRQSLKLEQANSALKERDRVIFDMVQKAIRGNDTARAQIYANELSRIRQIKKMISQSQLAIDCITIRLESFLDLYQVVQDMKPLSEVLRNVSADVQQVMPQFSSLLENLNEVVNEALLETKIDTSQPGLEEVLNVRSQAGGEILREVSGIVENSLHDSFPEQPLAMASRRAEAIACGFEQSSSKEDDWGELSDEVVTIIDKLESKNRVKIEEVVA